MNKPKMNLKIDEETFAKLLEGAAAPRTLDDRRMAALASALERSRSSLLQSTTPRPGFSAALREQLVAESMVIEEATQAARLPWRERAAISLQRRSDAMRRSFRMVAATGMAAMLMLGSSAALASARNALPGDWNYGIKRAQEGARLTVARSAMGRGTLQLDLARRRLSELRGLAAAGVREQNLYTSTLDAMDTSTLDATGLLVKVSRGGGGLAPLATLSRFAIAQRLRLEGMIDQFPAGARPAAQDSLVVLIKLGDRVTSIIAGCPCSGNPLSLSTVVQGSKTVPSVPCDCAAGLKPNRSDGSPGTTPTATDDDGQSPTPPPGTGGNQTPPVGSDLVPGTDIDEPANGLVDDVNKVLDDLGLPQVPTPTPLPTPSAGL